MLYHFAICHSTSRSVGDPQERPQQRNIGCRMINARAETAAGKPAFRAAYRAPGDAAVVP